MILNDSDIKHPALRALYRSLFGGNGSGGGGGKGLPADQLKRITAALTHLHASNSLQDIASGYGRKKRHHKLEGYPNRYAMEVNGNVRLTYDVQNASTGVVTAIDLEDYH